MSEYGWAAIIFVCLFIGLVCFVIALNREHKRMEKNK